MQIWVHSSNGVGDISISTKNRNPDNEPYKPWLCGCKLLCKLVSTTINHKRVAGPNL